MKLSKSIVGQRELNAVSKVMLESGYLGMGEFVNRFESELSIYLGVERDNVACVNSGTAALHLALHALCDVGSEVLVPSFTYVASWQAITAAGCIPVPVDICQDTLVIDLKDAERKVTSRTRVIMPVHYSGNVCDMEKLIEFASKFNLRIVEDAAHAFGASYKSAMLGSIGDVTCFSFDGIKNITSGEGGAVVTSDKMCIDKIKDSRLLGVKKDSDNRFAGKRSWDFDVESQGYRYHMSDIFAAIGLVQLSRLRNEFGPKRRQLSAWYDRELKNFSQVRRQKVTTDTNIIPHIYVVLVNEDKRDEVVQKLNNQNIPTGLHYKPNHLLSFFNKKKYSLPVTEKIFKEIITLPLHPDLSEDDIINICETLKNAING